MPALRGAGSADRILFGTHAAYAVGAAWSIVVWFQATNPTYGGSRVFAFGNNGTHNLDLVFSSGLLSAYRYVGGIYSPVSTLCALGKITCAVITSDGTDTRVYVDGALRSIIAGAGPTLTGTPELTVGNLFTAVGTFQPFSGPIGGEMFLFSRKLSAVEVAAYYFDDEIPEGATSAWSRRGWDGTTSVKLTGGAGNNGAITDGSNLYGSQRAYVERAAQPSVDNAYNTLFDSEDMTTAWWTKQAGTTVALVAGQTLPDGTIGTVSRVTLGGAVGTGIYQTVSNAGTLRHGQLIYRMFMVRGTPGETVTSADPTGSVGLTTLVLDGTWQGLILVEGAPQVSGSHGNWLRKGTAGVVDIAYAQCTPVTREDVRPAYVKTSGNIVMAPLDSPPVDVTPAVSKNLGAFVDARASNSMIDFGTHAAYSVGTRTNGSNGAAICGYFRVAQAGGAASAGLGTLIDLGERATTNLIGLRYASGYTDRLAMMAYRAGVTLNSMSGLGNIGTHAARVAPGKVYHFALTWDDTSADLYLDGVLAASVAGDCRPDFPAASRLTVGNWPTAINGFGGAIGGDWRVYNRKLKAGEVHAMYHDDVAPDGAVAVWGPNGWDGTTTVKLTQGSGNNGAVTNSAVSNERAERTGGEEPRVGLATLACDNGFAGGTFAKANVSATLDADGWTSVTKNAVASGSIYGSVIQSGYTPVLGRVYTVGLKIEKTTNATSSCALLFYNMNAMPAIVYLNTNNGTWANGPYIPGQQIDVIDRGGHWEVLLGTPAGLPAATNVNHAVAFYPAFAQHDAYGSGMPTQVENTASVGTKRIRDLVMYDGTLADVVAGVAPTVGVRLVTPANYVQGAANVTVDSDVSISAFVRYEIEGLPSPPRLFSIGEYPLGLLVCMEPSATNANRLSVYYGNTSAILATAEPLQRGRASHLVISVEKASHIVRAWVNGRCIGRSILTPATLPTPLPDLAAQLPRVGTNSSNTVGCSVSRYRLFKRALGEVDARSLYRGEDVPGAVITWDLDEGFGTTTVDHSNGNTGTVSAGVTWVTDL